MRRIPFFALALSFALLALTGLSLAADEWKTYTDKKFGFAVEYPAHLYNKTDAPYVDGDGLSNFEAYASTKDGDGKYAFAVSGGKKPKGVDGNSLLKAATNMKEDAHGYVYGVEPIKGTAKSGADFYTLDYVDDSAGPDGITHVYCVVGKTTTAKYSIRYPKGEAKRFAEITARMDASLKAK